MAENPSVTHFSTPSVRQGPCPQGIHWEVGHDRGTIQGKVTSAALIGMIQDSMHLLGVAPGKPDGGAQDQAITSL